MINEINFDDYIVRKYHDGFNNHYKTYFIHNNCINMIKGEFVGHSSRSYASSFIFKYNCDKPDGKYYCLTNEEYIWCQDNFSNNEYEYINLPNAIKNRVSRIKDVHLIRFNDIESQMAYKLVWSEYD